MAGFVLTTVFLLGPVPYLLRRWDLPAGAVLLVAGPQLVLVQALTSFVDPGLVVLGLGGTTAVEPLRWRPRPSAARRPGRGGSARPRPWALWGVWFGGMALADGGLGWEPEVWLGAVAWSALPLLALAVLAAPSPVPAEPPRPADHPAPAS